jgi:hypothetical protein
MWYYPVMCWEWNEVLILIVSRVKWYGGMGEGEEEGRARVGEASLGGGREDVLCGFLLCGIRFYD